jgi:hypothetical protein
MCVSQRDADADGRNADHACDFGVSLSQLADQTIPSAECAEGRDVRDGSFAEVDTRIGEVCFAPINGLRQSGLSGPKNATTGLECPPGSDVP